MMPAADRRELLDQVRDLVGQAERAGHRPPGRSWLARRLNTTEHHIRQALRDLRQPPSTTGSDDHPDTTLTATIPPPRPTSPDADESPVTGDYQQPVSSPAPPAGGSPAGVWQPGHGAGRRPWPLVVIGLAAAVSVWSGWVGLGQLAGFGVIQPLPGLWDGLRVNTAIVLPISLEAYAAYAMRCWLSPDTTSRTAARRFAGISAIISLIIGAAAQVAYHLLTAAGHTHTPWQVTVVVATVPVVVLGLATALASLTNTTSGHPPIG